MNLQQTQEVLKNVDIYVIDQILKGRFTKTDTILDAGCGEGRNLKWFYKNNYAIEGIDMDHSRIKIAQQLYPESANKFVVGTIANLPYIESRFDHVLCCAVLHFAKDEEHFNNMFSEIVRVLKKEGSLLIRMASNIGLDHKTSAVKDGKSNAQGAYYLTRDKISSLLEEHSLQLLEPVKTTNVQDLRAMTTLVLRKSK